jgi:hypothetical protein
VPQAYGLLQPSRVFEIEAEVVSDPPEQLRQSLLACGLGSGLSDRGRIRVALGTGKRLGKSISLLG